MTSRTTATALALIVLMGGSAVADARPARVKGNVIVDGARQELKVRGVEWGGSRFVPTDDEGTLPTVSIADAPAAFRQIQRLGGNLVRVNVSSAASSPTHRQALRQLQRLAASRGLILLLANVPISDGDQTAWLVELSSWFAQSDNVWYLPAVDPECGPRVTGVACGDTEAWIWSQTRSLRALRANGVRTPIVVNLPDSSRSVSINWTRALGDRNVVYGVHPPSSRRSRFGVADARALQTSLAAATSQVPVMFDRVGRVQTRVDVRRWSNGQGTTRIARTVRVSTDSVRWSSGLLDWVTGWTMLDGGDGAIVAGLGTSTRDRLAQTPRRLTPWGRTVAAGYLAIGFRAASGRDPRSGFPGGAAAGDRGAFVRDLQQRLVRLGYLAPGTVNGLFGEATRHGVIAFQGYSGLKRDGQVGATTMARLLRAPRPVPRHPNDGKHIEVDISRQIVMLVNARGAVWRVIHTSTGATGNTPSGRFTVNRKERSSWVPEFKIWLPYANYFHEGFALHEFDDVPTFPASHGCARLPRGEAQIVWDFADMGTPIVLYRS